LARLPGFLQTRLDDPSKGVGKHWVWISFSTLVARIATLAVLSHQESLNLEHASETDSLLTCVLSNFPEIEETDDEVKHLDGCYLFEDQKTRHLIRSGMTTAGFVKRFKEHTRASRLGERGLYRKYPHDQVTVNATAEKVGSWSQIVQRMALGIKKNNCNRLQTLFPLHEIDLTYLDKLKLPSAVGTSGDKHYRHLCYMFETFYACCIRPSDNITENPGCEWQLGLYSKKT
jgi:hypothetical protein